MTQIYHIHKSENHWLKRLSPSVVFYGSLCVFFLDNLLNIWVHLPLFTAYLGLIIPALLIKIAQKGGLPKLLLLLLSGLFISSLVHLLLYGFQIKNVSDTVYVSGFVVSYYYFERYTEALNLKAVLVFGAVLSIMFSTSFITGESTGVVEKEEQIQVIDFFEEKSGEIQSGFTLGARLEKNRQYHSGLFKVPHVGALLMGVCLIGFLFLPFQQNKVILLLTSALLLFFIAWSGTRVFFVALIPALVILLIQKKYYRILLAGFAMFLGCIYFRLDLYEATRHTPLGSLTGALIAMVDDWHNLSRIAIWSVWYQEVSAFSITDFLFGKGYAQSLASTGAVFDNSIWFHNDLLSIFYSYGLATFVVYLALWSSWIKTNWSYLVRNTGFLISFVLLLSAALINGLYFYQPLFYFYILFLIKSQSKGFLKPNH